jgi:hypothetical protein
VEFKFPPKPIKNREGEVSETEEEKIYRTEYGAYLTRKEMSMPLWMLHRTTLEKVFEAMKN